MSAQHTPGPWAVQDIGTNCLRITANMPLENIPQHVGADEAIWDAINVDLQQVLDDVSCWEAGPTGDMRPIKDLDDLLWVMEVRE